MLFAFVAPVQAAAPTTAAEHAHSFRARWRPELNDAVADAALSAADATKPAHCKLAVVGAGWGGAYSAWRLSVDTGTIPASDVCVFEANARL